MDNPIKEIEKHLTSVQTINTVPHLVCDMCGRRTVSDRVRHLMRCPIRRAKEERQELSNKQSISGL